MSEIAPELVKLTHNPMVKLYDHRDAAVAGSFQDHQAEASAIASELAPGKLFTLVQQSKKGYWVSEWTVVGRQSSKSAARRRAGDGRTLEQAVDAMLKHSSYHASHSYKHEEGLGAKLRKVFSR